MSQEKKFRNAYVMKPSFDFGSLKPLCEKLIFAVDGWGDHVDNIRDQLEINMAEFDATKDVLIPVGTPYINMMAGYIVQRKVCEQQLENPSYTMGVYYRADMMQPGIYYFWRIHTDGTVESYEV